MEFNREFLVSLGLTAGESRVVELLLTGKANKDIAAGLFITEKTVKFQLTRVYRKFNVKSRSELICKFYTNKNLNAKSLKEADMAVN